jgi:hypothetical protein
MMLGTFSRIILAIVASSVFVAAPSVAQDASTASRWFTCYLYDENTTVEGNLLAKADTFLGLELTSSGPLQVLHLEDPQSLLAGKALLSEPSRTCPTQIAAIFQGQDQSAIVLYLRAQAEQPSAIDTHLFEAGTARLTTGSDGLSRPSADGRKVGKCVAFDEDFMRERLAEWNEFQRRTGQ